MVISQDRDGNTSLHIAVLSHNNDLLSVLLNLTATISIPNAINNKNNSSFTPLMISVYSGDVEICKKLLDANADMTIPDSFGCNVIHIACKKKNLQLLNVGKLKLYLKIRINIQK